MSNRERMEAVTHDLPLPEGYEWDCGNLEVRLAICGCASGYVLWYNKYDHVVRSDLIHKYPPEIRHKAGGRYTTYCEGPEDLRDAAVLLYHLFMVAAIHKDNP